MKLHVTGTLVISLAIFLMSLLLVANHGSSMAQTGGLIDCREFVDQAEAQRFFEAKAVQALIPTISMVTETA